MAIRYLAPTAAQARAAIETQICPWCGRGPFVSLPHHTIAAHGIDKWQLREYADLTTRQPMCSPELSETLRAAKPREAQVASALGAAAVARGRRAPRRLTSAGRRKLGVNLGQPDWPGIDDQAAAMPLARLVQRRLAERGESLRVTASGSGGLISHTTLAKIASGKFTATVTDRTVRGLAACLDLNEAQIRDALASSAPA